MNYRKSGKFLLMQKVWQCVSLLPVTKNIPHWNRCCYLFLVGRFPKKSGIKAKKNQPVKNFRSEFNKNSALGTCEASKWIFKETERMWNILQKPIICCSLWPGWVSWLFPLKIKWYFDLAIQSKFTPSTFSWSLAF